MKAIFAKRNMNLLRPAAIGAALALTAVLQAAQIAPPAPAPQTPADPSKPHPLVWDAMEKIVNPAPGEMKAEATFNVTNKGPVEVVISNIQPSCGCTTAHLPPLPWKLPPGTNGSFSASIDLHGKSGTLIKTLTVMSSAGFQTLTMRVNMSKDPVQALAERQANMERSKADPQAVFKNNCATCHYSPLVNKMGEDLYVAGCAICHEPGRWAEARKEPADLHHRAEMVPDLNALSHPMTPGLWKILITNGGGKDKAGNPKLMPAFLQKNGGPLTEQQIDSLVEYCSKHFKYNPNLQKTTPKPAAGASQPNAPVKSEAPAPNQKPAA